MATEHDINEPILILVRRGRGDRGYLVAAVDDASNPFPCTDEAEVGKAIIELLNDPKQPRFDEKQLEGLEDEDEDLEDNSEDSEDEEEEGKEEEEEEEESKGSGSDPFDDLGLDPGEKLLLQLGAAALGRARSLSNDYRGRQPKRKKKSKKRRR